jgi:hypothetical protein
MANDSGRRRAARAAALALAAKGRTQGMKAVKVVVNGQPATGRISGASYGNERGLFVPLTVTGCTFIDRMSRAARSMGSRSGTPSPLKWWRTGYRVCPHSGSGESGPQMASPVEVYWRHTNVQSVLRSTDDAGAVGVVDGRDRSCGMTALAPRKRLACVPISGGSKTSSTRAQIVGGSKTVVACATISITDGKIGPPPRHAQVGRNGDAGGVGSPALFAHALTSKSNHRQSEQVDTSHLWANAFRAISSARRKRCVWFLRSVDEPVSPDLLDARLTPATSTS